MKARQSTLQQMPEQKVGAFMRCRAVRREARCAGTAGWRIAGDALVAWVYVMASKGRVFALAPLPLVNEPLPFPSQFRPKML